MTRKKSSAQLEREIADALTGPPRISPARKNTLRNMTGAQRDRLDRELLGPPRVVTPIRKKAMRDMTEAQRTRLDRELLGPPRHHVTKPASKRSRWNHGDTARGLGVPEDVVRRIYAGVQTAQRQGLYGGHYADFLERHLGRKLVGGEFTVAARAKEHLGYDPPGGYGGPRPKGSAKEPTSRPKYSDPKMTRARQLAERANFAIREVLRRKDSWTRGGYERLAESKDLEILRHAADELDVAGDLYEEAGAAISAGTLHERAKLARRGDYKLLAVYE